MEGMLDKNGRVIEEGPDPKPELPGDTRTYRLLLDTNQYRIDMENVAEGKEVRHWLIMFFLNNFVSSDWFILCFRMFTIHSTCL